MLDERLRSTPASETFGKVGTCIRNYASFFSVQHTFMPVVSTVVISPWICQSCAVNQPVYHKFSKLYANC